MNLRFRLNLVIVLIMLLIATAGIIFSVISAKHSVKKEVNSSNKSLTGMLDIGIQELQEKPQPKKYLADLISQIELQRHFRIRVNPSLNASMTTKRDPSETQIAPSWFINLVRPEPQIQSRIVELNNQIYTLILSDNPDNEIKEAWGETQGLFYLLALQSLLVWVLCHFILGQALKPLPALLNGIKQIESGDYKMRLGEFSLPEYKQIADTFNHAMQALHSKTDENRLLTQHSLNLQEQERRTLARELHDEIAQSLTAIKGIVSSIGMSHPQSKYAVDTILTICDDLFSVVRSMMHRLRPSSLDELGLTVTLQELVNNWRQANSDSQISLDTTLLRPIQSDEVKITIYRIIQESLNNISRHARASTVSISLHDTSEHSLKLRIKDDGIGFNATNTTSGFGLLGIRERIESLGGTIDISSQPDHGVMLTAIIPLVL